MNEANASPIGRPLAIDTVFRREYKTNSAFAEQGTSEDDYVYSRRQDFGLTESASTAEQRAVFDELCAAMSNQVAADKPPPSDEALRAEFQQHAAANPHSDVTQEEWVFSRRVDLGLEMLWPK